MATVEGNFEFWILNGECSGGWPHAMQTLFEQC
jgi:hypothetical protein